MVTGWWGKSVFLQPFKINKAKCSAKVISRQNPCPQPPTKKKVFTLNIPEVFQGTCVSLYFLVQSFPITEPLNQVVLLCAPSCVSSSSLPLKFRTIYKHWQNILNRGKQCKSFSYQDWAILSNNNSVSLEINIPNLKWATSLPKVNHWLVTATAHLEFILFFMGSVLF